MYAIVCFLAILLAATTAAADVPGGEILSVVRDAGCDSDLTVDYRVPVWHSGYSPAAETLYIGAEPDRVTESIAIMILLHEIGHCLQHQDGSTFSSGVEMELDADRRAVELACARGLDGPRLHRDVFIWAREHLGYEGDENHGSAFDRIGRGDAAAGACHPPTPQAL